MIYKNFGKTNLETSAIGFGGMRFNDQNDKDYCASLVKAAYDAGINYFDTAPGYGKSEELFGIALKEMKKTRDTKPFYVSTKTMKSEPAQIRKEIETSLERMGLEYIDFYHLWCIMSLEVYKSRKQKGVIKEFEKLKDEGLIKHISVSSHMTGSDTAAMLDDYPFESVLLGYSAANFPYRDTALTAAARTNKAVVTMNPLAGGVIPQNPEKFQFVKTRDDESVPEAAIRFLLNDPRITIALVGLSTHEQLAEAISAVDGFKSIPEEKIEKIRSQQSLAFDQLCTSCGYCDNCPEGVPVPKMMDIYNRYELTGKQIELIDRLRYHWDIPLNSHLLSACTQCGQCEETCTQKLPITERLKFIADQVEDFKKNA
jgi:hypothetical protein